MIEETAKVVAVEEGFVWVEAQRQSTCGSCAVRKGCGTTALAQVLGRRRARVRALNQHAVEVGDTVAIGIAEQALVRGSIIVYLVPLAAMLSGALLGEAWGGAGEAAVVAGGAIGLVMGFWGLRRYTRRMLRDPRFQPVVLRVLRGGGEPLDTWAGAAPK